VKRWNETRVTNGRRSCRLNDMQKSSKKQNGSTTKKILEEDILKSLLVNHRDDV
jgi:hypothetical protein